MREKKLPWIEIFKEFKRNHPNLSKQIVRFEPSGYAEITIFLNTGDKIIYNYLDKKGKISGQ